MDDDKEDDKSIKVGEKTFVFALFLLIFSFIVIFLLVKLELVII